MEQERPTPQVTSEILAWLEQVFPDRLPDYNSTYSQERTLVEIGAQKVIRKLRQLHNQQHAQSLTGQP